MDSKSNVLIFIRKKEENLHTERYREKGCVKTKAEMRVMLPQTKECQKPLKVGRDKEEFSPELSEDVWPCWNLDVILLTIRSVRK